MSTPLLETRGLSINFGALAATRDVSLRLDVGARHALIGPNGAGKTTLINLLTGVLKPTAGQVLFKKIGLTIAGLPFPSGLRVAVNNDGGACTW